MDQVKWNPGQLLELSGQYWKSLTLQAGVKLDVFTAIGDKNMTGGEVAAELACDKRAVTMLLNALRAMGLLGKSGDAFINTPTSRSLLSKDSPDYIGYIIIHHLHLADSWSKLEQAVKTGKPVRQRASDTDEEWREHFLMGMFNIAMNSAPQIAKEIDLADRRHLLDLGGGPGTYAIHFCLSNPQLKATVYDLPTTEKFAQKTIEKFNLSGRIGFMNGDYLKKSIEGNYDVAWLSQILHGEGPEDCVRMIRKTVDALEPGGLIIIHDFILENTMDAPVFPALFSLNMLLGTSEGQSYSEEQITAMLADADVKEIRRLPFRGPNDSGIIVGIV
jgi:predicted O-methyltransferase YrrM